MLSLHPFFARHTEHDKTTIFLLLLASEVLHASDSLPSIQPDTIAPIRLNCDTAEFSLIPPDSSIFYLQLPHDTNDILMA